MPGSAGVRNVWGNDHATDARRETHLDLLAPEVIAQVALTFLIGGFIKGAIGMGLPQSVLTSLVPANTPHIHQPVITYTHYMVV